MALSNNHQAAFWEAMKEKYEKRNENLRQQEICLRERLEQLKQLMEKQQTEDDCDCVPEKLEKPSLVQCLVQKGKELILGSCTCGDPKVGQEFLCACHIVDPTVPLNFDSNLCPNEAPTSPEGCLNKECDFYNPQMENTSEDPSIFSLKTTDIYYMDKLAELVKTEKCMQNKITELENKERSYVTAINDLNEVMKKKPKNDPIRREFERIVECLEGENRQLKNELDDLRLELKHCFERVEGPLRRSLENQKDKCSEMEKKLRTFQEKMTNKEDNYLKEINEIKAKLCQACCTMVDLNNVNSRLKNDLVCLESKCVNLEDELVKQQLKEAENILKFKKAISRRSTPLDTFNRGDDTEQDLENIARKLSETLKEVYPCVTKVPTELTETVKGIKQLTELVGEKESQRRKKRSGKIQNSIKSSTSQIESFCCCYDIEDSNPESTVSTKNISTELQTPIQDIGSEKQIQAVVEKTAVENIKEMESKSCECAIELDCQSQQTSIPQKQSSKDVVTEGLTVRTGGVDLESKMTGPSEEVISVETLEPTCPAGKCDELQKTLNSMCPAGKCDEFQKTLNLQVDTTYDTIDVVPEDIHVITTLAKTGSLEITTEGPPGVIETKVNYLPDGKIEIVTKLIDHNKLPSFLDGTLLKVPEQPPHIECNESKTCDGQCESLALDSIRSEVQEEKSTKVIRTTNHLSSSAPYGSVNVHNNFVLLNGTGVNPLMPNEWKNTNFNNDTREEFDSKSIVFNAKRSNKNIEKANSDEDLTNEFMLSSRPSLTDIEKCSLSGFTHPDALDTISEGDEEEISTKSDCRRNSEHKFDQLVIVNENYTSCNISEEAIKDISNDRNIKNEDLLECIDSQRKTDTIFDQSGDGSENVSIERKQSTIAEKSSQIFETSSSTDINDVCAIEIVPKISIQSTNSLKNQLHHDEVRDEPLCEIGDICIRSDEQSCGSFCRLYGNLGSFNLLSGNFLLRQTKSLYENKRRGTECLRVCKSAVMNLGTLKIDIEMIKFLPAPPIVGDFDDKRYEDARRHDNKSVSNHPVLEIENNTKLYPENDQVMAADSKKEGFDYMEILPEKMYQCYVCTCPKKEDKQDLQETLISPRTENLEERIDRLLQINPFATSHGPDCQCVDCLIHNAETNIPKTVQQAKGCKCSKNRSKSDKVLQEQHKCKCTLKKLDMPLELNNQGDIPQHDEDCTCVDCLCNPSNFKISKTAVACDCKDCKCDTCYDTSKNPLADLSLFQFAKPPEIMVMNVITPCDCGPACPCDPCLDPNRTRSRAESQVAENKTATIVPQTQPSKVQESTLQDPFNNRDTWKNVVGCHCPPLSNKKEVCDCKVCECKPCGYTQKARKPCDCKQPKEEPKSRATKGTKGKCKCDSCKCKKRVKAKIGDTGFENKNRIKLVQDDCSPINALSTNCNCEICECVFCSDAESEKLPENIKEELTVYEKPFEKKFIAPLTVEPCDRSKCDCHEKKVTPVANTDDNSEKPKLADYVIPKEKRSVKSVTPVENIDNSKEPKQSEGVIPDEEESVTPVTQAENIDKSNKTKPDGDVISESKKSLKSEMQSQEDPLHSQSHDNNNLEEPSSEDESVTSEKCYCSKCICSPCKSAIQVPQNVPHVNESHTEDIVNDIPPEVTEKKSLTPSKFENALLDKQQPASIVDQAQGDTTKQSLPGADNKPQIPCNCSTICPCAPCPDPTVKKANKPPVIGDSDNAKSEIMSVLERISCTCNRAENDFKPLTKQASNFESTVSKMKLKLNNLQQKCKDKDQIINAMTKDLRLRSQSGVFAGLLNDLAHPKERFVPDFNRTYVCEYLPKPRPIAGAKLQPKRSSSSRVDNRLEPILELDRYLPGGNEDHSWPRRNLDASGLEILDIRRVTIDSILIKWRCPCNPTGITGYQIFVNDELKYKVLSPNRTTAVLDTLDLNRSLEIMLFAMSTSGRCEPPALAIYKI